MQKINFPRDWLQPKLGLIFVQKRELQTALNVDDDDDHKKIFDMRKFLIKITLDTFVKQRQKFIKLMNELEGKERRLHKICFNIPEWMIKTETISAVDEIWSV